MTDADLERRMRTLRDCAVDVRNAAIDACISVVELADNLDQAKLMLRDYKELVNRMRPPGGKMQ